MFLILPQVSTSENLGSFLEAKICIVLDLVRHDEVVTWAGLNQREFVAYFQVIHDTTHDGERQRIDLRHPDE